MHSSSLTRLRAGFLLLAAALLGPLFFLLHSVQARLEAQRRLRHEIVAERIFDEMERELTGLLAREGERPSSAYDATSTRVETWAPFVVGYFTRDAAGLRVIAREQLASERAGRVEAAVAAAALPRAPEVSAPAAAPEEKRSQDLDLLEKDLQQRAPRLKAQGQGLGTVGPALPSKSDSESVLRQLNRSNELRDYAKKKPKAADKQRLDDQSNSQSDPLEGL